MLLADSAPLPCLVAAGARGKDGLGFRVQGVLVFKIPIAFCQHFCIPCERNDPICDSAPSYRHVIT